MQRLSFQRAEWSASLRAEPLDWLQTVVGTVGRVAI